MANTEGHWLRTLSLAITIRNQLLEIRHSFLPSQVQAFLQGKQSFPVPDPSDLEYSQLQLHSRQSIVVNCIPSLSFPEVVRKLTQKGQVKTQNQQIQVAMTFESVNQGFLQCLKMKRALKDMVPLNYDNFWKEKLPASQAIEIVKHNLSLWCSELFQYAIEF